MSTSVMTSLCCYNVTLSVILTNVSPSAPAECFVQNWPSAAADILHYFGWQDLLLIYDTSLCYSLRVGLLAALSERHIGSISVSVRPHVRKDEDIDVFVNTLNNSMVKNVLVCTTESVIDSVFRRMDGKPEIYAQVEWFVICSIPKAKTLQTYHDLRYLMALFGPIGKDAIPNQHAHRDESVDCNEKPPEIQQRPTDNVTSVEFSLHLYTPTTGTLEQTGRWSLRHGLRLYDGVTNDSMFACLGHTHLRVGVALAIPFLYKLSEDGPPRYKGMSIEMLDELALRLNFTYELKEPPDGVYGTQEANGTWNGMVGMLMRGELDLAIGPFTITSQREEVVDFTVPFMQDGGAILTRRSEPGADILTVFRPLPLAMWLSIGGALLITGAALYVITRAAVARQRSSVSHDNVNADGAWWSFGDSVFIVYGSLVEQGASRHPESSAGRLVLGCWWLFTILIVSIYTASLAAHLTIQVHESPMDTLQNLAASSLTPLTLSGTTWESSFQNDSSEVYRTIGARMTTVPDENEVADLVKNNDLAYIMDVSALDFLQMQDCKHLHRSKDIFSVNGLGLALPQGAKYRDLVNKDSEAPGIRSHQHLAQEVVACFVHGLRRSRHCPHGQHHSGRGQSEAGGGQSGGILILYGAVLVLASLCFLLTKIGESRRVCDWKDKVMERFGRARYEL